MNELTIIKFGSNMKYDRYKNDSSFWFLSLSQFIRDAAKLVSFITTMKRPFGGNDNGEMTISTLS